jgi:hypothetical protein
VRYIRKIVVRERRTRDNVVWRCERREVEIEMRLMGGRMRESVRPVMAGIFAPTYRDRACLTVIL